MITPVLPIYNRNKLAFERGEGPYLYTVDGTRYLDFVAGIAVNALGNANPDLIKALTKQAEKLWHVSNLYEIPGLNRFAERLVSNTFADTVFFCNSGTEAIECAIKMIRKYHDATGNPERYRVITFSGAFHGRTLAAASASNRAGCVDFEPAVEGFDGVAFGDIEAVRAAITNETAAILVEPIQGEGGIIPAPEGFLQALRDIANEHGLLLAFDEIQCGMGRTGKLYAYEYFGVTPDIITSAKGIGGGFPLGACLATEKAASGMVVGTHGSTYGGNPLAMAVGNAVLDHILADGFLSNVEKIGISLRKELNALTKLYGHIIEEVRGAGLMLGIKLTSDYINLEVAQTLRDNQLLTVPAADNVIRILPPLNITQSHIDEAVCILDKTLSAL